MAKAFLLLMGIPGAGKTTLMRQTLQYVPSRVQRCGLLTYLQYRGGVQLGSQRTKFGGTDMLPMNIQPFVLSWLETACPFPVVVAEGDRLTNDAFLRALVAQDWHVTLAWLDCPEELAALRRGVRRSRQTAAWVTGRCTKVARLATQWAHVLWRLDGTLPLASLTAQMQAHPVIAALGGARVAA